VIKRHYEKIIKIKNEIQAKPEYKYNLEKLALKTGVSTNHFCRLYKNITGETVFTYLNKIRVEQAKELLIKTNWSIETIAYKTGFENTPYFYRQFKKNTSMTPNDFRQ